MTTRLGLVEDAGRAGGDVRHQVGPGHLLQDEEGRRRRRLEDVEKLYDVLVVGEAQELGLAERTFIVVPCS